MHKHALFRRCAKSRTDQAISEAYGDLAGDSDAVGTFSELLLIVRRRSDLLSRRPYTNGRACIEALRNLTEFSGGFLRDPRSWTGCHGSIYCVISSLAQHLLSSSEMPKFLGNVWFGELSSDLNRQRRWYLAHGAGQSFRSLDLPVRMTRRMESLFLRSPDHLSLEAAIRRSELLALGGSNELVDAVLASRVGNELAHGKFWRSIMMFLVRVEEDLHLDHVAPIIDFLHGVRYQRLEIPGSGGYTYMEPPRPDFSIKGRTLASVLRQTEEWHKALGLSLGPKTSWQPSRYRPLRQVDHAVGATEQRSFWELVELTDSHQLVVEGRDLRHCVAMYSNDCRLGGSRIWSLRRRSTEGSIRPVVTIEVDPRRNMIVQARSMRNRPASGRPLELIHTWAEREGLRVAV